MYSRCPFESNPVLSSNSRVLCQNRISHKPAKPETTSSVIRSLLMTRRLINQCVANTRERAITLNNNQSRQTFVRAVSVRSPLPIGLPEPGSLGVAAEIARRQAEPMHDTVQLVSL